MINWQKILWDLRRQYKPLRAVAFEIGANPSALQKVARYGVKTDMFYHTGAALLKLHERHCND